MEIFPIPNAKHPGWKYDGVDRLRPLFPKPDNTQKRGAPCGAPLVSLLRCYEETSFVVLVKVRVSVYCQTSQVASLSTSPFATAIKVAAVATAAALAAPDVAQLPATVFATRSSAL